MTYGSQIWSQIQNKHVKRLTQLQNKAIRIIHFASYRSAVDPFLYVTNSINGNQPSTLKNIFTLTTNAHKHNTCGSAQHQCNPQGKDLIYRIGA